MAGEGERWTPWAGGGERTSLPGRLVGSMGLLLCLGGDMEEGGGVRRFWVGELLRLGDLEGRRLGPGDGRLGGDPDGRLF